LPSPELRRLLRRHDWSRIAELMDKLIFDQERSTPERATAEATA
jgi:hypothetical protein